MESKLTTFLRVWKQLNKNTSDTKPGSYEALNWLIDDKLSSFVYDYFRFHGIIQLLINARTYKKLVKTCDIEQIYELDQLQKKTGFERGMRDFMDNLADKIKKDNWDKRAYLKRELKK